MAFEKETELLEEYNIWVGRKKMLSLDTSPTAFLIDRGKEAAFAGVLQVIDYLDNLAETRGKMGLTAPEVIIYNVLSPS